MRPIAIMLAVLVVMATTTFEDGPPPAHTGGFGEPSCAACHFDGPVDDGGADLEILGLPRAYEPGETYRLRVMLSRAGIPEGGFQLAARDSGGAQAGTLEPADGRSDVTDHRGVQYVHHTRVGTAPTGEGCAAWDLVWTAPRSGGADVVFSLSANAANADDSQLGDHIYTHERRVPSS